MAAPTTPNGTVVIVNHLPDLWDEARLHFEFDKFRPQSIRLPGFDRSTGRHQGYAFVEFDSEEDAQQAIVRMNGIDLEGATGDRKRLKVTLAKPRDDARFNTNVYLSGLPLHCTEDYLRNLCGPFGTILEMKLLRETAIRGNHTTLSGFVRFSRRAESDACIIGIHGITIAGPSMPQDAPPPLHNKRGWVVSARYATDARTRASQPERYDERRGSSSERDPVSAAGRDTYGYPPAAYGYPAYPPPGAAGPPAYRGGPAGGAVAMPVYPVGMAPHPAYMAPYGYPGAYYGPPPGHYGPPPGAYGPPPYGPAGYPMGPYGGEHVAATGTSSSEGREGGGRAPARSDGVVDARRGASTAGREDRGGDRDRGDHHSSSRDVDRDGDRYRDGGSRTDRAPPADRDGGRYAERGSGGGYRERENTRGWRDGGGDRGDRDDAAPPRRDGGGADPRDGPRRGGYDDHGRDRDHSDRDAPRDRYSSNDDRYDSRRGPSDEVRGRGGDGPRGAGYAGYQATASGPSGRSWRDDPDAGRGGRGGGDYNDTNATRGNREPYDGPSSSSASRADGPRGDEWRGWLNAQSSGQGPTAGGGAAASTAPTDAFDFGGLNSLLGGLTAGGKA